MPRNSRKQPRKCGKRSLGSDLCSFDKRVLRRRRRRARMDTIRFICGADLPPASAATRIRRSTARQPPSDSETPTFSTAVGAKACWQQPATLPPHPYHALGIGSSVMAHPSSPLEALLLLLALLALTLTPVASAPRRPHIILIIADDLGYPLRAGEPRGLPLQERTLAQRLRARGYATHLVGKWHLGAHRSAFLPTRRGFDSHFGYRNGYERTFTEMVSQLDESVGTVLDALRETGMLNNSIVVGRLRAPRTPYAHPLHVSDWAATLLAAADEAAPDHPPSDDGDGDIFAGVSHWHALSAPADEEVPAPRESLLLNVDDVIGLSGVLAGRWKYVEGTHDSGAYDGHLGAPARGAPYPAYDAQATADAARALGLDDNVTAADVLRTLAAGAVSCNGLQEDPCETRDASAQQPAQLQRLRALLGAFRAQQAPQLNAPVDPRADPALHGGVWAPWLDGEDEDEVDGIDR
ncbi:Arylsulfatase J, partial [Gryllus bimaculatus]